MSMETDMTPVSAILENYTVDKSNLIPIMLDVHEHYTYLSKDALIMISDYLGVSISKIFGVATFYENFSLDSNGKFIFRQNETCGKCVPCREGTKRMLEILERIVTDTESEEDLFLLQELADTIANTSLCGLGKTAASSIFSSLKYFKEDYKLEDIDAIFPTQICFKPSILAIDPDVCKGCTRCARNCPADAITGAVRQPHEIDTKKCIKCRSCIENCNFGAIKEIW